MLSRIAILAMVCCAHTALGGFIVSPPNPGWADQAWVAGEEYRWGATARNMDSSADTWELGVGNNSSMTEGGGTEAHLNWGGPGTAHSFILDYDPLTARVTWTIDGQDTVLQNPAALFTDMYIQLKTMSVDSFISVSDATLQVGGTVKNVDDFAAYGDRRTDTSGLQYVHVNHTDGLLSDMDFILEGTLYIDWSGTAPTNDEMGFHLKFTQIPEPASIIMVILVSVTGLFIRRRLAL